MFTHYFDSSLTLARAPISQDEPPALLEEFWVSQPSRGSGFQSISLAPGDVSFQCTVTTILSNFTVGTKKCSIPRVANRNPGLELANAFSVKLELLHDSFV